MNDDWFAKLKSANHNDSIVVEEIQDTPPDDNGS